MNRRHHHTVEAVARTWRDARAQTAVTGVEVAAVTLLIVLVQTVFFGYYAGTTSPTGDFLGPYANEAYAWWHAGGLVDPPDWMPQVWAGYPALASIQNSAWYLPVGLASLVGYDIHAATVVQALHIAFAGLGVYVLGRRLGLGRSASAFGLVAYSLSTGFFSNAPYVDIVRGHAFAPWVLLCLSPLWPWRRRWAVPAAAVLLWQVAVGVYPGMLIVMAYAGFAWALVWQVLLKPRLRSFLIPLCAAGLGALLLAMPKYLPLLALQTVKPGTVEDLSVLRPSVLGTFVLPVFDGLPGIATLNSYFVPAAVLTLCGFAVWRRQGMLPAVAALAVAALLSVPALGPLLDALPGVGASRFRQNDARPFVLLPLVLLAMSGLADLLGAMRARRRPTHLVPGLAVIGAVVAGTTLFLTVGRFREGDWVPAAATLAVTAVAVAGAAVVASRGPRADRGPMTVAVAAAVLAVTAASGLAAARATTMFWAVDTVSVQHQLWGTTSGRLIEQAVPSTETRQRPARSGLSDTRTQEALIAPSYNASYYTGLDSVGGYLNVQNSPAFVGAQLAVLDPEGGPSASALLEAAGLVVAWPDAALPAPEVVQACATSGDCGGIRTTPMAYSPGELVYEVSADVPTRAIANEAYYPGWSALLVDESGRAQDVPTAAGPAGLLQLTVPPGSWRLVLTYDTPHGTTATALGLLGVVGLIAWSVPRRRRSTAPVQ